MDLPFFIIYPLISFPLVWWLSNMQGPVSRLIRECFLCAILCELGCGVGKETHKILYTFCTTVLGFQAFHHHPPVTFFMLQDTFLPQCHQVLKWD